MLELSKSTTDILRGVAIIAILLNHSLLPYPIVGQLGVAVFLSSSGYGLARSYGLENIDLRRFAKSRFKKFVLPVWACLTITILYRVFLTPGWLVFPGAINTVAMNYALIYIKPYDIFTIGWFITYLAAWYLLYVLISRTRWPQLTKVEALFCLPTPLIFFFGYAFFQIVQSILPTTEYGPFHFIFAPYALFFPLGVYAALGLNSQIKSNINNHLLEKIGQYSVWIYLLHPIVFEFLHL